MAARQKYRTDLSPVESLSLNTLVFAERQNKEFLIIVNTKDIKQDNFWFVTTSTVK